MALLGVNIDHVATVRQARGTDEPDPIWAAAESELGGADGITLDCAGHSIIGPGSGNGIYLRDRTGVTVRNCHVSNFEIGIKLEIAKQLNYLQPDKMASIEDQVNSVSIKLSGLIRHLRQKIDLNK